MADSIAFEIFALIVSVIFIAIAIVNIILYLRARNQTIPRISGVQFAIFITLNSLLIVLAVVMLIWALVGIVTAPSYSNNVSSQVVYKEQPVRDVREVREVRQLPQERIVRREIISNNDADTIPSLAV